MAHDKLILDVTALFIETGENHHKAFIESQGVDPEWPLWYSNYLHSRLGKLLNTEFTKSEIIYLLFMLDKKIAAEAVEENWTLYYAKYLVDNYN